MLVVQPYCGYLTRVEGLTWRDADWAARFYALMLKGDPEKLKKVRSYQDLPIGFGGTQERVQRNNVGIARVRRHFGGWATRTIRGWGIDAPVIIPVPNSHVTADVAEFPTLQIAAAVGQAFGGDARVLPVLRFQEAMEKSHLGGTRSQTAMIANMHVLRGAPGRAVLVDDMTTTGSHLRAARTVLENAGYQVEHTVVGARCDADQLANPFVVQSEDLDAQGAFDFGFEDETKIDWPDL